MISNIRPGKIIKKRRNSNVVRLKGDGRGNRL